MPPTDRFVISFAAEPPQEGLPYGRWADTLAGHFLGAVRALGNDPDVQDDLGEPGEVAWFPDRTYSGRTYIPAVAHTTGGYEVFGYVSFAEGAAGPADFEARADYTAELAENNPDWKLDLSDDVIGRWRGEEGRAADITLVWGVPLVAGGALVTAELANLAVDQCALVQERFTLVAPDNYRSDYLDVKLWSSSGDLLAAESLYVEDDEGEAGDSDGSSEPESDSEPNPFESDEA